VSVNHDNRHRRNQSHMNIIDSFMHCSRISVVQFHGLMPTLFEIFEMCREFMLHNVCTYDISGGVGCNCVCACVRACVRQCVCTYLCVHVRMRVCVCAHACEHLITIHVLHRKLVVNGVLVYIHDAHIRLGIGFAGTCMLQCVSMCTAVCTEVCCSVLRSRLHPRRAHSPWQWLCWYICVAMCIAVCTAVCTAVCCSVLQCVAF